MVDPRRVFPRRDDADAGVTMVELLVTIFVFAIFLSIVTSSLIGITRASTQAQTISRSSTGVLDVFQKFDRAVRYADVINAPGATSSGRYVEFRIPAATTGGAATCVQWRFVPSSQTLQTRQWADGSASPSIPFVTKLKSVFDKSGNYPFALVPAGSAGSSMQQLTLTVVAGNAATKTAEISTTFVARNSTVASNSLGLVCSAGTMRP
jgi:prepilin-type N-terminal cleavage/methylation domain-containing protein